MSFRFRRGPSDRLFRPEGKAEAFGAAPAVPVAPRPRDAPYTDHRLRGLDPAAVSPVRGQGPYDMTAQRHAVTQPDPYDEQARREMELGRRMPLPYQIPSALAGMPSITGRPVADSAIYEDLSSDQAVHSAGAVSGARQTQMGTFGARTDTVGGPWNDARKRFGYGQMGSRDAGYSEEWDTSPAAQERTAGRLTSLTKFDQQIMPHRPYLHLRARGASAQVEGAYEGNALLRVTAGNFQHGGQETRTFWLGGGMVGSFLLQGWDNVKIEVLELMDGTFVEFAWSTSGMGGESRTLYLPEAYTTAPTTVAPPEGAFAVQIENPVPAVAGTVVVMSQVGQIGGAVFTFLTDVSDNSPAAAPRPYVYFSQPIELMAPTFRINTSVDLVWWIRPI